MEWTIAVLLGVGVVLLILSYMKTKKTSKELEQQIDHLTFSFMDEVNKMKEQIRNLELDAEIAAQEAGNADEKLFKREILDMHRRGYSMESIANKMEQTTDEIERLLTPYMKDKQERGSVTDGSES
ncbi:hypothetical protein [Neobacillus sp. LXY-4]|uniref:hypothetical protein n=1 Tax=Neobacillus sp. LXY-4 TaxID=3379826 RepID=UPI003EE06AE3